MAEQPPPMGELGSMLSWSESMFIDYLDPSMGSIPWWEARDYATMLRVESQARKVESLLTLPLLSAPTTIRPGKGDKGECDWVTEQLTTPANNGGMSTPLALVIAQMTTSITYRVASFEKVWKEADAPAPGSRGVSHPVTYDKLAFRPATNTRVLRDRKSGAYMGLRQDPPYGEIDPIIIKPDRAFTHVNGQHRSPLLGSSDMEIPLVCHRAKQKLRFLWFLFLELHAQPRTTFSDTAEGAGRGDMEKAKSAARMFTKLRGGGAIALPPGVQGNVLETSGHAADLYQTALHYLDSEMTGQVLAQFSDLASAANTGTGSFALSRDGSDFFRRSRQFSADEHASTITNYVIADLVRRNYGPDGVCPTFSIGPLAPPELDTLLTALAGMSATVTPPPEFVAFLIEQTASALGMPPDQVAELAKKTIAAQEKAATTQRQAQLAPVVGTISAAEQIARKAVARGAVPAPAEPVAAAG